MAARTLLVDDFSSRNRIISTMCKMGQPASYLKSLECEYSTSKICTSKEDHVYSEPPLLRATRQLVQLQRHVTKDAVAPKAIVALVPISVEMDVKAHASAKAECGTYAPDGKHDCPLNVCCSQYGYCGTTEAFCGTGCQKNSLGGGCGQPSRPSCSANTNAITYKRRVAYYELFHLKERLCDYRDPEDINVAPLTNINLAFVNFGSDFKIIDTDGDLISRATFLKARYPGLKVSIAIGGWTFNDPPTSTYFSDMASTVPNRETFINSLTSFLTKYGLDGVDIDWEYPAADDRGGKPADTDNFVLLMSDIREAFNRINPSWQSTITIPTSYWYLRGFDIVRLEKYVDWFNLMSYDLHGMWDQHNRFTGPYLEGHTNVTEIDNGLDLLWRNGIKASNVVMGVAFYGRSFTVADTSCTTPGCVFATSGQPGTCTNTAGILSYSEVASRNTSLDVKTFYDPTSTVKYNVFQYNQWISYDDEQSFFDKKKFLSSRCLSGLMIWAIDQDTEDHKALDGLFGDSDLSQLEGGNLDPRTAGALSSAFGAYTGQNCFVTPTCTDGSDGQKQKDQVCPSGYSSVSTAHNPLQKPGHSLNGDCAKNWFRYVCCPTNAMPKNCKWNGAPVRSEFGCSGKCSSTQFLLATDTYIDLLGAGSCYSGTRDLCCDSTTVLDRCFWTDCQGPFGNGQFASCGSDDFERIAERYDLDNGEQCTTTYNGGKGADPVNRAKFRRAFCCPKGKSFKNCHFSNNPTKLGPGSQTDVEILCKPSQCSSTETQVTEALDPPDSYNLGGSSRLSCDGVSSPPGFDNHYPLCCDPPGKYSEDWPVDPKDLFSKYYNSPDSDVMWSYDDEYRNNNADPTQAPLDAEDGSDAYGFIMLDGAPGSLDNSFGKSNTIARRSAKISQVKRSLLTSNKTILDATFDHSEETIYFYCNHHQDSAECKHLWIDGAEDTIIRLPAHIGEGPFARVVSVKPAEPEYELPGHHVYSRSLEKNANPIYKMVFDYNFDHITPRADGDVVNMRVDYTNLLGYWDSVTDSPANKKRKRDMYGQHLSNDQWKSKIHSAKKKHEKLRKRQLASESRQQSTSMDLENSKETSLHKRWFGSFVNWLGRLTTVESKNLGYLSMAFQRSILLFKTQYGCPGKAVFARLRIYFDANVEMEATYAYYFSGTIVPPAITGTYAYIALEPSAYLGIRIEGNAAIQQKTDRKKLLDTISYPGLSIKGIAAVGPTLDLYGQIRGAIRLKGTMKAGAKLKFGKAEVYWPQDDSASDKYQKLLGIAANPAGPEDQSSVEPTFDARVAASAQLDIIVTPEVNMGIKVGGGSKIPNLMQAQLVGYVNSTLQFSAQVNGHVGTGSNPTATYKYGVYLLYNLGYGAVANIPLLPRWTLGNRYAFSPSRQYPIYEQTGSFAGGSPTKRAIDAGTVLAYNGPRKGAIDLVNAPVFDHDGHLKDEQEFHYNASMDNPSVLGIRADPMDADSGPGDSQTDFTVGTGQCTNDVTDTPTYPDLRYNCNLFGLSRFTAPGFVPVNSICSGIQGFFTRQGVGNSDIVLTHDNNKARSGVRRGAACGTSYCKPVVDALKAATGDSRIDMSCDEFPFAGSLEGGSFYGSLANGLGGVAQTCVPRYQQSLQGNCNKILNALQMNVDYYDKLIRSQSTTDPNAASGACPGTPDYGDDVPDNWYSWGGPNQGIWTPGRPGLFSTDTGKRACQRYAEYPTRQPPSGVDANQFATNPNLGWMFRKNFTVGLAIPSTTTDGAAWAPDGAQPATSWHNTGASTPVTDVQQIACAVNIFNQDEVYRYAALTGQNNRPYNALCLDSTKDGYKVDGFDHPPSGASMCLVEFGDGATGSQKRSLGAYGSWTVTNITIYDDEASQIDLTKLPEPDQGSSFTDGTSHEPDVHVAAGAEVLRHGVERRGRGKLGHSHLHNHGHTNHHG
ncbi:hypothetical protein VTL71DRAFT_9242 [Oculimacula yallundae]|uniref:chitinase n=1 Tax=Oculimacula yallundae TaxID=86028 RepID=A0ABR4BU21_9HELO